MRLRYRLYRLCGFSWFAAAWCALALALCVVSAMPAIAQTVVTTGPVDTSMWLEWNPPDNVTTVTDALTFEWRLRDGAIPATALTLVTCAGTPILCQSDLTLSNVDALNRVGVHSLTLSAFRADVGDSRASLPFSLQSPATAPTNLSIMR